MEHETGGSTTISRISVKPCKSTISDGDIRIVVRLCTKLRIVAFASVSRACQIIKSQSAWFVY